MFKWSLKIFLFKNRKMTLEAVKRSTLPSCDCLFSLVCWILLSLSLSLFFFPGSSLGILLGDALLSAHYQQLKNFQFSAHSVLVKIEYISLPLYHVENLRFMVCWNSSCYIQNASPGSSNNAQDLSTPNSQCFCFNSFSTLFTWRYFVLIFPSPLL